MMEYLNYKSHYHITSPTRAGTLIRTFGTMCLCTANRVEAMKLPGGLQTQEHITDSHIVGSDLVTSFTNIFSDNCSVHHAFCSYHVMFPFVCDPPGHSMASTLFPTHTVQR